MHPEPDGEDALTVDASTLEQLRLLADNVPDMISLHDLEGRFLHASPAAATLLGMDPASLVGRSVYDLVLAEDQSELRQAHRDILARAGRAPVAFRARRLDGSLVWLESTAHMTESASPESRRIVAVTRDITERRVLEHRLLQAEKMEAVGRLAAGIAHDFNNLLTVVIGRTEIAQIKLRGRSPSEDLDGVMEAARRAGELVQQLMAFSRAPDIAPRSTDLNEVIRDFGSMLRRLVGEDVLLVTELAPDLWPVRVDPAQLQQVVLNLVVNARDAMPTGGTVRISTANLQLTSPPPRLPELRPGDYVRLDVVDTGQGMSEETVEHIFEPFFSLKAQGAGNGLGLASVHSIVTRSGGRIDVESSPGAGAAFRIYLPRSSTPADRLAPPATPNAPVPGSETVLVVEDDEAVRTLVQTVLEGQGYRVLTAATGRDAMALFEAYADEIALVVSDVIMPGIAGPQMAAALRHRRPGLPVLFVSGYHEETIQRQGTTPEGAEYLAKPFLPDALARQVRAMLDRAGPPPAP